MEGVTQEERAALLDNEKRWRCDWCGEWLDDNDVEPYGRGFCHVVAVHGRDGEPEPSPCGPVLKVSN